MKITLIQAERLRKVNLGFAYINDQVIREEF